MGRCDRSVRLVPDGNTSADGQGRFVALPGAVRGRTARGAGGRKVSLDDGQVWAWAEPAAFEPGPAVRELSAHPVCRRLGVTFADAGFELSLVGGAVRDTVAGSAADFSDLDFTTNATVEQIKQVGGQLGSTIGVGEQFGTVVVNVPDGTGSTMPVEITTYRTESYEEGSRKPQVVAAATLHEDLQRRDFTINALAVDVASDTPQLVDPFGGADDLAAGLLRTPGDPYASFSDDPLRILRLVRFAGRFGFRADEATSTAATQLSARLQIVSQERKTAELLKLLASQRDDAVAHAISVAAQLGVTDEMFGGLAAARADLRGAEGPDSRLVALVVATEADRRVPLMRDMKLSGSQIVFARECAQLIDEFPQFGVLEARRAVRKLSDERLDVAMSLGAARAPAAAALLGRERADAAVLRGPLPVDGHACMAAGLEGPQIGRAINAVEEAFLADPTLDADAGMKVALATAS